MTSYPHREHEVADKAAHRRALACLSRITDAAAILRRRLEQGIKVDASESRKIIAEAGELAEYLSVLETLGYVREWHAADKALEGEA